MEEWKRVFLNRTRFLTILLMVFLCVFLYFCKLLPSIGPGEIELTEETAKYTERLYEKWQSEEPGEVKELSEKEAQAIYDYVSWYSGYRFEDFAFENDAGADRSVSDAEYLVRNKHNLDRLSHIASSFAEAALAVGEQAEYTAGYSAYLEKIQKQAEDQAKTDIFGKADSFSARNLKKTAEEFKVMKEKNTKAVFGNSLSLEK